MEKHCLRIRLENASLLFVVAEIATVVGLVCERFLVEWKGIRVRFGLDYAHALRNPFGTPCGTPLAELPSCAVKGSVSLHSQFEFHFMASGCNLQISRLKKYLNTGKKIRPVLLPDGGKEEKPLNCELFRP